jgi:Cytidylate kinase-like family
MTIGRKEIKYVPGTYAQKRPDAAQLAEEHIQSWVKKQLKIKPTRIEIAQIRPSICFSRKIGVGALQIADLLAEKLNYRVADRVLLDYMAKNKKLSKQTIEFFDERYPGKMSELASMLFGERSFIMSDYIQNFISATYAFADMGSIIFVGRGIHLLLPRDRLLAVRIICSDLKRISRLAKILDVEEKEAKSIISRVDKEQREFFKKAYGKNEASPYEFDMVINCDFIDNPPSVAEVVAKAYFEKFATQLDEKKIVQMPEIDKKN